MPQSTIAELPSDTRARLGAWWFIGSLVIFFFASILMYGIYAYSRRDDPLRNTPLPMSFLASTVCLIAISGMVHQATLAVRRDRWSKTAWLLSVSTVVAIIFLAVQAFAMQEMLSESVGSAPVAFGDDQIPGGAGLIVDGEIERTVKNGQGVVGMVVVLAFLHALHVAGGVISLAVVAVGAAIGRYDHERHFAVDFAAQYWHFLDLVWLVMLAAFWATTGGFEFGL